MTTNQPDPHTPADCFMCGKRAIGIGLGLTHSRDKDPKWLCAPCSLLLEDFRKIKRMDAYELKAREGGVEAAGEYLSSLGKTDLAEFQEEEALMLVGRIWDGCANHLRALVREGAPF